jgi:phosphorylcholine metabolism protein LicD
MLEQLHLASFFHQWCNNRKDTAACLMFGALIGYEAAGCFLPHDDDIDLMISSSTMLVLDSIFDSAKRLKKKPSNKHLTLENTKYFPGNTDIWLSKRKNYYKLIVADGPIYGQDPGGLDIFPVHYCFPKFEFTAEDTYQKTVFGFKLQLLPSYINRRLLDIRYGEDWRLKILLSHQPFHMFHTSISVKKNPYLHSTYLDTHNLSKHPYAVIVTDPNDHSSNELETILHYLDSEINWAIYLIGNTCVDHKTKFQPLKASTFTLGNAYIVNKKGANFLNKHDSSVESLDEYIQRLNKTNDDFIVISNQTPYELHNSFYI